MSSETPEALGAVLPLVRLLSTPEAPDAFTLVRLRGAAVPAVHILAWRAGQCVADFVVPLTGASLPEEPAPPGAA